MSAEAARRKVERQRLLRAGGGATHYRRSGAVAMCGRIPPPVLLVASGATCLSCGRAADWQAGLDREMLARLDEAQAVCYLDFLAGR